MTARAFVRGLRGLTRHEPASRDGVLSYQMACLGDLLSHAYRRVPYYRRLFDGAGIRPEDVRSHADLAAIPPTSRSDVQFLPPEEVCAQGYDVNRLRKVTTSGSTGNPLTIRRTMNEERLLLAFRARAAAGCGLGFGSRRVQIDHLDSDPRSHERLTHAHERIGILPRLLVDWRTPKTDLLRAIEAFRPDIINGPPSILSWLADELTDEDRRRIRAKLVLAGSEMMTSPMRRSIRSGFGVPVGDIYGSHEAVFIAMNLPGRSGYRVCEEATLVEVLRDGVPAGPGESGELYVTALHSYAMPFVRYRLGDSVVVGPYDGPYLSLQSIEGRTADRFILPDGRKVHGYTLGEAIESSPLEVRRFQITQERRDRFNVRLVLRRPMVTEVERLRSELQQRLSAEVQVEIEVVDSLDPVGRKFYSFISVERLEAWRAAAESSVKRPDQ